MDEKALMQHMTSSVATKCDQVLTMELKRNVVDIVNKALDPLKSRIEAQISNKMNNSEQVHTYIKDSLNSTAWGTSIYKKMIFAAIFIICD